MWARLPGGDTTATLTPSPQQGAVQEPEAPALEGRRGGEKWKEWNPLSRLVRSVPQGWEGNGSFDLDLPGLAWGRRERGFPRREL